jgi:probable DNA metabolism protein
VHVPLSHQVDIVGFHAEATRLLAQQVPPETVEWSVPPEQGIDEQALDPGRAAIHNRAARAIVPQSFIRMSELVVLHRDPARFDLLYRSLWRLVHEPDLKNHVDDADLAKLRQMAQSVRRDIQKMKTRIAFHPVQVRGEAMSVAWYEPVHYICETVGGWLAAREPASCWILLTPERSMLWDGRRLLCAPPLTPLQQPRPVADAQAWSQVLEALSWS